MILYVGELSCRSLLSDPGLNQRMGKRPEAKGSVGVETHHDKPVQVTRSFPQAIPNREESWTIERQVFRLRTLVTARLPVSAACSQGKKLSQWLVGQITVHYGGATAGEYRLQQFAAGSPLSLSGPLSLPLFDRAWSALGAVSDHLSQSNLSEFGGFRPHELFR